MRYLSLLLDSVRESLDRKPFIITLVFCSLFISVCASVGFEPFPLEKVVERRLESFFRFHSELAPKAPNGYLARSFKVNYKVMKVRESETSWTVLMEVSPFLEFQKLVRFYLGTRSGAIQQPTDPIPGVSADGQSVLDPPSPESMAEFIESKMSALKFASKATIESGVSPTAALRLEFKPDQRGFFLRGHRVNVLFGAWKIDVEYSEPSDSVYFIQKILAGVVVGWVGVFAGIVLTAAFIPNMLQKGTVDLILSRPVRRWKVFLMKYLGGLTYVFVTAVFLIGGCWIALGLRSGSWSPMFLVCIPFLLFFFAAVHAVSAFIGLHKRNVTEAIMVAVFSWLSLTSLGFIRNETNRPNGAFGTNRTVAQIFEVAHAVTPPLGEVGTAVEWFLMKGNEISPERFANNPMRRPRDTYPEVRWAQLFGVTGAWMAFLLGLSCWTFSRRDY